jgi:hypothetical protein
MIERVSLSSPNNIGLNSNTLYVRNILGVFHMTGAQGEKDKEKQDYIKALMPFSDTETIEP